ncbi:hypothetical protein PDENDC454_12660 [Paenibacillus dendritiformis C454]|uniref:DUF2087 domain-containing protein n=1 Tax=Paenibacillus dendritiformis C454 TaxID=1131935 RepID=H3SG77_9BACL|nr:hypothetical protein PDENDC454_12660 [Paenibacillus dendritiformis C454]
MRLLSAAPAMHADYVTLRRYLIEYGFLNRQPNESAYGVKK